MSAPTAPETSGTPTTDDGIHPYARLVQPDTNNATWFNPNEKAEHVYWNADEYWQEPAAFRHQHKATMWTYLSELNDGVRNGKRTNDPYYTYLDNWDLIENVAMQLDLPRCYWGIAKRYYWSIHHKVIRGVRKDATAVAIVAYVIEKHQPRRPFHPNCMRDDDQTIAEWLAGRFALTPKEILNRYGKIEHFLRTEDATTEPEGFDRRNMSRRGLHRELDGDYTDVGFGGVSERGGGI